ncbi:MAG: 30S ribosomal protein S4 [Candidatus Micrarchaeota archaeon]
MGAKRLRKQYEKPKKLWNKQRIDEESKLREEYGLKNARELWKMQTILRKTRREARRLLSGRGEDTERKKVQLLTRLSKFLVRKANASLDDVLSLSVRDILERRLQTVACKRHIAKTVRQARQFITHGHVSVHGVKISSPSYLVRFNEEESVGWYGHAVDLEAKPSAPKAATEGAGIADAKEITAKSEKNG